MGHPYEALLIQYMLKWPQLHLMTSAYLATYMEPAMVKFMDSSRGRGRLLFASDHPVIPAEQGARRGTASCRCPTRAWPSTSAGPPPACSGSAPRREPEPWRSHEAGLHLAAHARATPDKPALVMAPHAARSRTYRRARRRLGPPGPRCCARGACAPATTWRCWSTNEPAFFDVGVGRDAHRARTSRRSTGTSPPPRRATSSATATRPRSWPRPAWPTWSSRPWTPTTWPRVTTRLVGRAASTAPGSTGSSRSRRCSPASSPATVPDEHDGGWMFYSSGTTGRAEGDPAAAVARRRWARRRSSRRCSPGMFGFDADTVYLSPAPLYHAAPGRLDQRHPAPRRHRRW